MDVVDFKHLHTRLQQNTVQEKLSNLWLNYLLTVRSSDRKPSSVPSQSGVLRVLQSGVVPA
jgi:hypothetical protein